MRSEVTASEVRAYRDQGFVVLEGFLRPREVDLWRRRVAAAVTRRGEALLPGGGTPNRPGDDYYRHVFAQHVNLWVDDAGVRDLVLDPRIGKMACHLEGIDGVRVWHDQSLCKDPWANPTAFHLDVPYWSFTSRHACSIWVALDDTGIEDGCLWFFPGSHRKASFDRVEIGPNLDDVFRLHPEFRSAEAVATPMRAGDCSFHNGLTIHGAGPNMTPRPRRAMTCAFMPDGSRFNGRQNVLPDDYFASLAVGDLLDDDGWNPVVWRTLSG